MRKEYLILWPHINDHVPLLLVQLQYLAPLFSVYGVHAAHVALELANSRKWDNTSSAGRLFSFAFVKYAWMTGHTCPGSTRWLIFAT